MPAPSPSAVLDNPPPLTPRALRQFPFAIRPFPFAVLSQAGTLRRHPRRTEKATAAPNRVEAA